MAGLVSQKENVSINISPVVKCWRMVYNSSKVVIHLWEGIGVTRTLDNIFISDPTDGTVGSISSAAGKAQCMDFIAAQGLSYTPKSYVNK
jgi:hypothetical protein